MIMHENLQNEQSSCSFSRDKQISHYEFVLQKHCDYWLENKTLMLRSVPQMLKKWRIVVNKISKVRRNTWNWIKKILDEATRIVNVFLISWFFYLFLFNMFNKLTCKVPFHIAAWSLSKSLRASSFIENVSQISAKPISFQRNLLGKLPRNRPFFTNRSSVKLASKIPAKFPRNRPFFPRICPWKSREIRLFFPRPTRSPDV